MSNILHFIQYKILGRIEKIKEAKTKNDLIREVMLMREDKRSELVYKHISKEEE
jgi:hypothetical protein|tara:strand:+ start:1402 stop:1563 length:162 start_codon:yes stop_codon:yes gene_type:complete